MIAIHDRPGSFSDKWIEYCDLNNIPYKLVDCYGSNIVDQLVDSNGLMWHWAHFDHKAALFARQLTYSVEAAGKHMFPSAATVWHFDDKVGQKYLFESIGAPLVPSYVFYDMAQALGWAENTKYPKVFKLRGGAGAENVHIVRDRRDAERFIRKAFGRGFKVKNRWNFLKERLWHFRRDKSLKSFLNISKGLVRFVISSKIQRNFPPERNYAYFQDFIPENDCDIRIIVIGKRAFAIKRMIRKGDFRASGSGDIIYDPTQIPAQCLKLAFEISENLGTQSLAYDFVFDGDQPLVVEVSCSFSRKGYLSCPGYWTDRLEWVEGKFFPEYFMVEDFAEQCDPSRTRDL
jgi:glutathione synthase/RimK-type ligase-like ATP-grasp enzyme